MNGKWSAQIQVKWNKNAPKSWEWLSEWSEVKTAWSTMGDWDMTLWVEVEGPKELEDFVQNKLWSKDWVENTKSTWSKELWFSEQRAA